MADLTIVTMIWTGRRGYTLAHAAVVAKALARHTTVPYRFVVLSDQVPSRGYPYEVLPFPQAAAELTTLHFYRALDYPACLPKLWLLSTEAETLGERLFYLDADTLVIKDLAPILSYDTTAPFVGMTLGGQFVASMYLQNTPGSLDWLWQRFLRDGRGPDLLPTTPKGDQQWMRHYLGEGTFATWPQRALGIYLMKDIEVARGRSTLPSDARIIHPTGKVKPWEPLFLQRHPWAKEYYPWA